MTELATINPEVMEMVAVGGDLSQLSPEQRVAYYMQVCQSLRLNPATKPFEYIRLNNKLTLYARRDATDQLRALHGVSITGMQRDYLDGLLVVTVTATDASGRQDVATGAVTTTGLKGDAMANAMMRAETKAKRRVTLSLCGLGWTDESEVETIPNAVKVEMPDSFPLPAAQTLEQKAAAWLERMTPERMGDMSMERLQSMVEALGVDPVEHLDGKTPEELHAMDAEVYSPYAMARRILRGIVGVESNS